VSVAQEVRAGWSGRQDNEGDVRYLTVRESAKYLNTPERFVRRLIAERRIAYHKIGKYVRLAEADVAAFVAAGRVEAAQVEWRAGEVVR
jgi:excisionase family DNA binding protein